MSRSKRNARKKKSKAKAPLISKKVKKQLSAAEEGAVTPKEEPKLVEKKPIKDEALEDGHVSDEFSSSESGSSSENDGDVESNETKVEPKQESDESEGDESESDDSGDESGPQVLMKIETPTKPSPSKKSKSKRKQEEKSQEGDEVSQKKRKVSEQKPHDIFVGGLNYKANVNDVKQFFEDCGEVTKINIPHKKGRSLGIAFLSFETHEASEKALLKHQQTLLGRTVNISKARRSKKSKKEKSTRKKTSPNDAKTQFERKKSEKPDGCRTLFCNNLPFDCTKDELRGFFEDIGEIKGVRMPLHVTGSSRGYGYINFSSENALEKAMKEKDQQKFKGRLIWLDYASYFTKPEWKDSNNNTNEEQEIKKEDKKRKRKEKDGAAKKKKRQDGK